MEDLLRYFPDLSETQQKQLSLLPQLYADWNAKINVISRKDMDQFFEHHVLHSLAIAHFFPFASGSRLLDVGTGGGFPAVPLAIMFPEVSIRACDSVAKKIKVVQAVTEELKLKNLDPVVSRAEELPGPFDCILSRAVAPLSDLYRWSWKLLHQGAQKEVSGMLCLKGGDLEQEIEDLLQLNGALRIQTFELRDLYKEPFFETKKLLHIHL